MEINIEKLKKALFNSGTLAVEDFCGMDLSGYDKESIDKIMDEVIDQMPDDTLEEYYKIYVTDGEKE